VNRNMIDANRALFARLLKYADDRDYPVSDPQAARWVHANPDADKILTSLTVRGFMSFGRFRHLAWLALEEQHYIATVGFEYEIIDPALEPLDDIQGYDVCLLSELLVSPNASASTVYNVVGASSRKADSLYPGHDNDQIMGLFPPIRVFASTNPINDDLAWPMFLDVSAEECRHGESWIEDELANSLSELARANVSQFPYKELCRSALDLDPRSLFMSLYRCIEATYAHDQATKLKKDLAIEHDWNRIAKALEDAMSWRPLEATSLNVVLGFAQEDDLRVVCDCLGVQLSGDSSPAPAAGKAIYKLRNRIVHYRPALARVDSEALDWNRLCIAMVSIATDVFRSAYGKELAV
jgi:hypothetical protein